MDLAAQQKAQFQQLTDARYQRSQGDQTGFDDENDNRIDDRARSKVEFQQRATQAYNRDKNSNSGNKQMAASSKTSAPAAKAPVQYNPARYQIQSLTDLQNYSMQSSDRRYNTDKTSDVNLKLGSQKNQIDYAIGMDKNAVTRDVGMYSSDNQLRASNYKSYSDLQASLNRNTLQSGDNRFETTTKYGTQERINQYNRNTLDQTAIAEAQIKSGTYGMSKESMQKSAADKTNFDNWKNYNDAQFNYADRTNAQIKLGRDMANSERAYSDSRNDRSNDSSAAMARFQIETYQKDNDRNRYYSDLAVQRQQTRDDFNLRSQQIQNQIDIANKDYAIRYGDASLRQQQYAATRADIGYNRSNQSSSLAF